MTLKEAISILSSHQKWRLGDEDTPMTVPSELTDAIATILDHIGDTNKMAEISDQDYYKEVFYQKQVMNPYSSGEQSYTAYEKGFMDFAKWYREQLKSRQ